jgi:4-hydroxybenzoate polyprenyltransferase/phosphoserine phosphatase
MDAALQEKETLSDAARPLVVDLDGTLVRSDTLHEALLAQIGDAPLSVATLLPALRDGKAAFKRRLADLRIADADSLPLNEAVRAYAEAARAAGRRVVLVTAADRRQAEAVAARLGLFHEVHATGSAEVGEVNLGGAAKAAFLEARFGRGGFDYIGDSAVDLPVWASAGRAVTVGAGSSLRRAIDALGIEQEEIDPPPSGLSRLAPYLRALRPHQWAKNFLVFLPVLAAHEFGRLPAALAAFAAFSLVASSVYLLNDMLDLRADRAHPRKRLRPFAAGAIPLSHGAALAPALALVAAAVAAAFASPLFLGVLVIYYATTFAYSLVLKRKLIVDVLVLAGLYTIRILGGAAATEVALSPWMLAFSMFLFLALASVKRQSELVDLARDGREAGAGRAYRTDDLPVIRGVALSAGHAAVMVFALYINSPKVSGLYSRPELLWLVCPLLLYWLIRMVMATHRGRMTDDPIVYAAGDRISQLVVAMAGAVVVAAGLL